MDTTEIISKIYFPKNVKLYNFFGLNKLGKIYSDESLISIIRDTIEDEDDRDEVERAYRVMTDPIMETIYRIFGKEAFDNENISIKINWETIDKCCRNLNVDPNEGYEYQESIISDRNRDSNTSISNLSLSGLTQTSSVYRQDTCTIRSNKNLPLLQITPVTTKIETDQDENENGDEPVILSEYNIPKNMLGKRTNYIKPELITSQSGHEHSYDGQNINSNQDNNNNNGGDNDSKNITTIMQVKNEINNKTIRKSSKRYKTIDHSDTSDPITIWLYKKKSDKYMALVTWDNNETSWCELRNLFKYQKVMRAFLIGTKALIRGNFKLRFPTYYDNLMNKFYTTPKKE